MPRTPNLHPNMAAFLDLIAWSEGTTLPRFHSQNDGYDVIVGGSLFDDYSHHPQKLVRIRPGLSSTAAGRYQLLGRYYEPYRQQLGLSDFGPESQDAIAIQQIKECRAVKLIVSGQIEAAIKRCARIWASLPGAGYGQHENRMADCIKKYGEFGGAQTVEARSYPG